MTPTRVFTRNPVLRLLAWLRFAAFYLAEIIRSNLLIARDVLTPKDEANPGILALDLPEGLRDWQVLLISNLITMTPGTLALELCANRRTLLLHVLYLGDVEETRHHLLENYVHRVRQLT